jgi:uncharacterized membrane protein
MNDKLLSFILHSSFIISPYSFCISFILFILSILFLFRAFGILLTLNTSARLGQRRSTRR